ncbi:Cellulose biosynthesis protein BcsQ [Tenacibaculum sp. MAR_2009_124]|uniref:ParA family protein n=1 Tax=Tenacibaculum sp. MAR_2009_124 TaxID=1250059 RepID=UPI0008989109|nr:ParA family protein [Tenacibaculum sp. MAR_2009_124]SEC65306.1 Cellulose biosynthesis protein BcsQ [Tenacibaculum sp. MAR_2009_124]
MKEKNTKIISAVSSKGGVGKSTLNILLATNLYYKHKKSLVLFDTDNPQYSLHTKRLKDIDGWGDEINSDEAYPIVRTNFKTIFEDINEYYGKVDYIIIDFPGTINKESATALFYLHHIFIPFTSDEFEIESTYSFYENLMNHYINNDSSNLESIHVFFNQYERVKKKKFEEDQEMLEQAGVKMLKSRVLRKTVYTEKYRDTLCPIPDVKENHPEDVKAFFREVMEITK